MGRGECRARGMTAAGETIIFAPRALIYHIIQSAHATPHYLRKNARQKGISEGIIAKKTYPVWKAAADTYLGLIFVFAKIALFALTFNKYESLIAQTQAAYRLGFLNGYRESFRFLKK